MMLFFVGFVAGVGAGILAAIVTLRARRKSGLFRTVERKEDQRKRLDLS